MNYRILLLLSLLLPSSVMAQAVFTRRLRMSGNPSIHDVAAAQDGSLFACYTYAGDTGVAKFDAVGQLIWAKALSSNPTMLKMSATQMLYAASNSNITKLDLGGNVVWSRNSASSISRFDIAPDGDIFTMGGAVSRYDSSGTHQWSRSFSGLQLKGIAACMTGGVYVVGNGFTSTGLYYKGNLLKLSDAGTTLWNREADNNRLRFDFVVEAKDRQPVVAGSDQSVSFFSSVDFIKFDSMGNRLWHNYGGPQNGWQGDYATDLTATADSGIAVIGSSSSGPMMFYSDNFLYYLNKSGTQMGMSGNLTQQFYHPDGSKGGSITSAADGTILYAHNWQFGFDPGKSWIGKVKPNVLNCQGFGLSGLPTRTSTFHAGTYSATSSPVSLSNATTIVSASVLQDSLLCSHCFQAPIPAFSESFSGLTTTFANSSQHSNSYHWDFGDGSSSTQANPTHVYSQGGQYSVCLTASNACSTVVSCRSIIVPCLTANVPIPWPSLLRDTMTCGNVPVMVSSAPGFQDWSWSNGGTLASTTILSPSGISLIAQNTSNGCYFRDSLTASDFNISNTLPSTLLACPGSSVTINAPTGWAGYAWSNGATTSSITTNVPASYIVTVTHPTGCTSTDTTVFSNYPAATPTITPSGPTTFCTGSNVTLSGGAGYSSYQWSNGATTPNITVSTGGTYVLTVTSVNGCTGTASQQVIVNASPFPTINPSGTASFCAGASITLSVGQTYPSYNWSTGANSQSIVASAAGSYAVTVTAANGCTGVATKFVNQLVAPSPSINASGPTTFCPGGSVVLSANSTYSGYSWSTGATTSSITVTASGTYTLTVTSSNGCTGTASRVVTVGNPIPTITPGGPTNICPGGSVTLTGNSGYTAYSWSTGSTAQTITASAAGTYTLTVTAAGGCTGTASQIVIVSSPTPTITPSGPTTICTGGSVTLSGDPGYLGYNWSTGSTAQSITANAAGTYTLTVTGAGGCTGTTSQAVSVSVPTPSITPSGPTVFCTGGSVTLAATTGMSGYNWSTGSSNGSIVVSAGGSYTVTVTDAFGCQGTASQAVTVNPLPSVGITPSGSTTFCAGGTVTLAATNGMSSYNWSTGSSNSSIVATTSGIYTVTATDANGCQGTASQAVNVNPSPSVGITPSGPTTFCTGGNVTLTATAGMSGYSWSTGSSGSSIVATTSGSYSVTATDANGCQGTASQAVTVNPLPSAGITPSGPTAICTGGSVTLAATSGMSAYFWSTGSSNGSIVATNAGSYAVTVTDANGCQGTASQAVTVNPLPSVGITPSGATTFCAGGTVTLAATSGMSGYSWNTGSTNSSIVATTSGTYTVTATDANGCQGTASQAVNVNPSPSVGITPNGPTTFCTGGSVTLAATAGMSGYSWSTGSSGSSIVATTSGSYSVTATDANGCQGTASQAVTVNPLPSAGITPSGPTTFCAGGSVTLAATTGLASYTWSNGSTSSSIVVTTSGNYAVTVTNSSGCQSIASLSVTVNPSPSVAITPSGPINFCAGGSVTLTASSPGLNTMQWSTGATSSSIVATTSGSYSVTATNSLGCSATASIFVTVNPSPTIAIASSSNGYLCFGTSTTLSATTGYSSYAWSNGSTSSSITVSTAGTYTVTVTSAQGCSNVASRVVTAINQCQVPSGLFETQVTNSSAILNWNAVPCVLDYQLQYRKTGTNPWTTASVTTNSYKVVGLTGITSYEWRVRARCNSVGGWTSYSAIKSFSTNFMREASSVDASGVELSISVAPNPSQGQLTLEVLGLDQSALRLEVLDMTGKLLHAQALTLEEGHRQSLNLSHLAKGVVLLRVTTERGQSTYTKAVLQ